jgi:hypothetical protein
VLEQQLEAGRVRIAELDEPARRLDGVWRADSPSIDSRYR